MSLKRIHNSYPHPPCHSFSAFHPLWSGPALPPGDHIPPTPLSCCPLAAGDRGLEDRDTLPPSSHSPLLLSGLLAWLCLHCLGSRGMASPQRHQCSRGPSSILPSLAPGGPQQEEDMYMEAAAPLLAPLKTKRMGSGRGGLRNGLMTSQTQQCPAPLIPYPSLTRANLSV